jgi:osmotically-inducible protein OsmY
MSSYPEISDVEQKLEPTLAIVTRHIAGGAQDAASTSGGDAGVPEAIAMHSAGGRGSEVEAGGIGVNGISDAELTRSARLAIERDRHKLADKIAVVVRNGWLILEGEVEGLVQKRAAEVAVRGLHGIRGVSNNIRIESEAIAHRVSRKIDETFIRSARLSAHGISVTAWDHKVILSGWARSAAECQEAEVAAWAVRGVAQVVNRIRATT